MYYSDCAPISLEKLLLKPHICRLSNLAFNLNGKCGLRGVERALVDFPAMRGGRKVYLCWLVGEKEISHWHEVDAGFDGRQPL